MIIKEKSNEEKSKALDSLVSSAEHMPCDFCGGLYKKSTLEKHKRRHVLAGNKHKCDYCDNSFTMMTKLLRHKKKVHGIEMNCNECDRKFKNVYYFATHVKNHKKERSFACDICDFKTTGKPILLNHKLVKHSIGSFPFHCSICKKGFLSKSTLNDHMNKHTGATPHQCDKCGSAFASSRALVRHCRQGHPEMFKNKLLRCGSCSRVFKSEKKMNLHREAKHPEGYKNVCDFCGKNFSFRESLVRHRRIHTGEKPKECSVCKKRFSCASYLQSHLRTHTGEKPYQCGFCWKTFTQRSSLVTHEKSHMKVLKFRGLEIAVVKKT